jgi:hypothetical protein
VIVITQVAADRQESALCARTALAKGRLGRVPTDQTVLQMFGAQPPFRAVLGLLILGLMTVLGLAACAPAQPSPEKAIVGEWVNSQGGVIYFYTDKTGFIPGDEGQTPPIPSVKFSYDFQDETHLVIKMDEQNPVIIEIKLEGDKMTWFNRDHNVEYVYTKMK